MDIPLSPGKLSYGIKDSSKGNELNVSNEDELNQCVINTPISEVCSVISTPAPPFFVVVVVDLC
ncbi:unnamed protein product [Trichobilharzia regenti]|nr:unnamed protein product [Trichobilharzia regenti]